jgi:DNA-binding beta-propeller fold protein YncE
VLRFPAYEGTPLTNADWRVGSKDDNMCGASGIAVDPTGTYVAVAFTGLGSGFGRVGGGVRVFRTADGSEVRTLSPAPYHDYTDVAWDNAGNLYVSDNWSGVWRAYSPPGANQTSTVSIQTLEAGEPPIAALLRTVVYSNGQFMFTLRGRTNIFYVIEGSTDLRTWIPVLTNRDDCATRLIVVDSPQSWRFYRALAP